MQKSYFESGDGTSAAQFIDGTHGNDDSGCAFEIKYPIQLYYFAWLQALGYFNIPNEGQNSINQVYFYLSADLDMSGYVLPQIGTQEYPFVGNFDGNGHTISNLKVQDISQISSGDKWTDMPDGFTPANANIVGFFGVIGSLYTTGSNAGTVNGAVGTTSFTPTAGYTYSSQVNEAKNFALNNINITTQSNQALIGIAAGYVNGEMSNVQVVQSGSITKNGNVAALTSYTSNLSDYTLVGYVTDAFKDTSDVVFAKVDTPSEKNSQFNYASQGASAGWGGSIDMADMYNRILGILSQSNSNITYNTTEVRVYDESGNVISTQQGGSTATTAYRKYTAANDGSGNYMLTYRSDTKRFHYLTSLYKQVSIIKRTSATEAALYIKSGNTYLNINSNHNGISTNGNTTKWVLDSSGYLRTSDDSGMYYLNYSGTNFTLGTTGTTVWTRNGNTELQCSYGYIQLVNGAWTVRQDVERYYTIA
ncbi:MAG: hypothetical protein IKN54_08620, partial [Lachnospiraceae bacterium]|nr:hypothetical protein [Lachnospiraceae bacterium]